MTEPTVDDLASDLLASYSNEPYPDRGEPALWRLQRWMDERPDDALSVLEALVKRAGTDVELMVTVSHQCDLILSGHYEERIDRVMRLLAASPLLDSMVGPEILTPGRDECRYRTADELASVWLAYSEHSNATRRVDALIREAPDVGLRLALEIVERGPLHGFESWDVHAPLFSLLRFHGASLIEAIESAAAESIAVRRVIWECRRLDPEPDESDEIPAAVRRLVNDSTGIPSPIRRRFQAAAGTTTTFNSPMPRGHRSSLGDELDAILDRWFAAKESFWAYCELDRWVHEEPELAWEVIESINRLATTSEARTALGCGSLEDLVRENPAEFVDRIEALALESPEFRETLGCTWLTLEDVPEPLARRYWEASGRTLSVLDAPEG